MTIRRVTVDALPTTSFPLQSYAFNRSPDHGGATEERRRWLPYLTGNRTLVAEEEGTVLATVTAIPMRQNLRGRVLPMAGVSGVATHPLARRRGHVRALLNQLLDEMREEGHPLTALYPFRASFYERFGYTGLPMPRTVSFSPADLGPLVRAELAGEVTWERTGTGYPVYREFLLDCLHRRHGFAVFPEERASRLRDDDDRWLVAARVGGRTVGTLTYRIEGHGATLVGDELLAADPHGRALLLQFLSRHVDQVERITVQVPPHELPELWLTDLDVQVEARISGPAAAAPMARLLALEALTGLPTTGGRVTVEITGDRWLTGTHLFDGEGGRLELGGSPGTGAGTPTATLTAAGLSALAFGVLDPAEVRLRGLGEMSEEAATELRRIFPPEVPYLHADF